MPQLGMWSPSGRDWSPPILTSTDVWPHLASLTIPWTTFIRRTVNA